MAVFIVTPKVMFTCQSEGAILYSDLYYRLTYPQRYTDINTCELFTFACMRRACTLKEQFPLTTGAAEGGRAHAKHIFGLELK